MNKPMLLEMWDQFRQIQGVTVRTIERIPADKLDAKPIPNMRTVRELVDHMYVYVRGVPGAILKGELLQEDCPSNAERLTTPKDLLAYAHESFRMADQAIAKMEEKHLGQPIPTFFGRDITGSGLMQIVYDEHLHHRGQFYAYLRVLGIEPPFLWSFTENAPEYQPRELRV
ncbi:MAG TPA: DinB family protein [Candidatus Eisenbacteria bacterium]|nr:DinB family protein [Candidatus Eisenbacteria bacterium]